jgi:AcrR family transcriptional regulator
MTDAATWREMAVARSLDPARARAEKRVQRFLDAALTLMQEAPDREFTVQEVVERSGQSLRSFYQYFEGKHELLLALFEEALRSTAEQLRGAVDEESGAEARLHRFTVEYCAVCRPVGKGKTGKKWPIPAMAEFTNQLLTSYPTEASLAFVPLVDLLVELLDEAVADGVVRDSFDSRYLAGVMLQMIMFHTFGNTIAGVRGKRSNAATADELWDVMFNGLVAAQAR